jgi:ATP phosphoribosyltransferase
MNYKGRGMKQPITIALSKGRLLPVSIRLLEKLGLHSPGLKTDTRKLYFKTTRDNVHIMIVRAVDVPTYVEYGAADIGIAGKDILLEQDKDVYEPLDLKFGHCRVVLAEPTRRGNSIPHWARLRIATKYPTITEQYFSKKGLPVEIIKLYGSIELAPGVGLADQVVDLISTGKTLQENHLTVVEEIAQSTARLIVNRASLKLKYERIREIIEKCKKVVGEIHENH